MPEHRIAGYLSKSHSESVKNLSKSHTLKMTAFRTNLTIYRTFWTDSVKPDAGKPYRKQFSGGKRKLEKGIKKTLQLKNL